MDQELILTQLNELENLLKNEQPNDKEWNRKVASLYYATSNFKDAAKYYGIAFKLGEEDLNSIKEYALSLFYSGNYPEAKIYLMKAYSLDSSDMISYGLAMNCEHMQNTPAETEVEVSTIDDYYVIAKVADMMMPHLSSAQNHFTLHREPLSAKVKFRATAPNSRKKAPLYETMSANLTLLMSKRVRDVLAQFNFYRFQIFPTTYFHEDGKEYDYYIGMCENVLDVRNDAQDVPEELKFKRFRSFDDGTKIDFGKLNEIQLEKRLLFEVESGSGTLIIHKSVANELKKLRIKELHLVPLKVWTGTYAFRPSDEYSTANN